MRDHKLMPVYAHLVAITKELSEMSDREFLAATKSLLFRIREDLASQLIEGGSRDRVRERLRMRRLRRGVSDQGDV